MVKEIERLTGQIDFKSLPHLLDEGEVDVVGSVASFGTEQEFKEKMSFLGTLGGHFEEFVDELILNAGCHSRSATALGPSELCVSPHSPESFVAQLGIRETLVWRSLAV